MRYLLIYQQPLIHAYCASTVRLLTKQEEFDAAGVEEAIKFTWGFCAGGILTFKGAMYTRTFLELREEGRTVKHRYLESLRPQR